MRQGVRTTTASTSAVVNCCHFTMVALGLLASFGTTAAEIDPASWPAAWHQPMATASELGLTHFQKAPMLAEQVAAGTLPPLQQRLPTDPVVLQPINNIGQYGGTARIFRSDWDKLNNLEGPLTVDPSAAKILPNVIERWEYSDNNQVLTLHIREGLKWSDGSAVTAADFIFYHQHVTLNTELNPITAPQWVGSQITAIDDLSFRYEFPQPFPLLINIMAQIGDYMLAPSAFMQQFHPAFVDRTQLLASIYAQGYVSWMSYFNAILFWTRNSQPLAPTLRPYQMVERTPIAEYYSRNPYYWKVDPEGNQLPYIDKIRAEVIDNADVMAAKASTGQVDFAAFEMKTQDFPLFKLGEKTAGIKVLVWHRIHGSDVIIMPNLTIDDSRLRTLFRDRRFRRALSVAINRDEMNSVIYFGRGTPRQATVIPTSRFYAQEFAQAFAQYDPAQANSWLDEMGLIDVDGDGLRNFADGAALTITLEYIDFETPKNISLELVVSYWRAVGIDLRLKEVDQALQYNRATGNLMQMTAWHADRSTDILFPWQPQWYVPMHIGWEEAHWNSWSIYYLSGGARGEQPPAEIIQLQDWWQELTRSAEPARVTELGRNILRSSAENVWTIGTVGLAPQPVIVSGRLHNVPAQGYWGWDNRWTMAYHPATWYLTQ